MLKTKGLFVFGLLLACLLVEVANAQKPKPTPAPCRCPKVPTRPSPVCGSNGLTYRNVEVLECANCKNPQNKKITVAHKGNCRKPPPCTCPKIPTRPAPVCGSNGQSYRNVEILECVNCKNPQDKKITVVHKGNCRKPPQCTCPKVPTRPAPVCGSNGQSYQNVEILECVNCKNPQNKKITVVHKGNCRKGGH